MQETEQRGSAKRFIRFVVTLAVICLVVGALMGLVNHITAPRIDELNEAAKTASLRRLFPGSSEFRPLDGAEAQGLDAAYAVFENGTLVGYVGQATVSGSQGLLDVMAGIGTDDALAGIVVGPTKFSETSNIGSRTKNPEFTEQFIGLSLPAEAGVNVDTVSGATISSKAVLKAVNLIGDAIAKLKK